MNSSNGGRSAAFEAWVEAITGIIDAPDRESAMRALRPVLRAGDMHPILRNAVLAVTPLVLVLHGMKIGNRKRSVRLNELEQGMATLTAASQCRGLTYRGVWAVDDRYELGDIITMAGSVWYCQKANHAVRPGESSPMSRSWQLMVKRGRDGRDGRPDDALRELVQQLAARVDALEQQLKHEPSQ